MILIFSTMTNKKTPLALFLVLVARPGIEPFRAPEFLR